MPQEIQEVIIMKLYEGNYKISSSFGPRKLDNGDTRVHRGIDCVGIESKNIIAPTNGLIVSSKIITNKNNPTWEWGNYVKMDDLNGFYLFFCHLASRSVKTGQKVDKGQIIGVEGRTGYVVGNTGNHLHFEVRRKSDNVSIDPEVYSKILADWEFKHFRKKTQERFGFNDNTMKFFEGHPCPSALFEKLATMK